MTLIVGSLNRPHLDFTEQHPLLWRVLILINKISAGLDSVFSLVIVLKIEPKKLPTILSECY